PMYVLLGAVNAVIFAYVIISMQTGSFLKFKKPHIKKEQVNVSFNDVIGLEEAKRESQEIVELIKDRRKLHKIGGRILKGILMLGPPGCGKTLMAKAIAKECGVPFLSAAGSEFVEVFVGMGANRIRKLFKQARLLAYGHGACIVFIDELDVIGRGRTYSFMGGGEETNSTQNQLLVEMDGLKNDDHTVIVIGATNADESVLDKALLRPGRFDRKIYIDRPSLDDRTNIFEYYLKKVDRDPQLDIPRLARKSVYKTPADIDNIIKEAALIALRNKKELISLKEISEAMDRIDMGIKHKIHMTQDERTRIAYHETGHLIALYFLHPTDDVFKASIVSRGGTLGSVLHQPRHELFTVSREQMLANIKVCLGGYVTEKIKTGSTSSGCSDDFKRAMSYAHAMVWKFGMGIEGYIGDFTVMPQEQLSEDLKNKLNNDTHTMLQNSLKEVEQLIHKEWKIVERFAGELLEKDELEYDEIEQIFKEEGKSSLAADHPST
ncbi:MAG: AAA family ATPase, partial [bacterium]